MKLGFQENKNGNSKLTGKFEQEGLRASDNPTATPAELTADNLKFACAELGIPDDSHTLRRAARAFDLYYSGKVEHVNDHTFKVASQYDRQRPYQVTLHYGATKPYGYCTCKDWMNFSGDMDVPNVDHWCKHMISAALWLHNNGNGRKRIVNECGSTETKVLQDKLNGNNGNGAYYAPQQQPPVQLEIRNPFQECELKDIAQIEGRSNGELAWTLRNGETVISYAGVMALAEKHSIEFTVSHHEDTNTVIAYARRNENRSERVSGKPVQAGLSPQMTIRISGSIPTASELAKRNAARQLIPFAEIKVLELACDACETPSLQAKLEADFSWEAAYKKCAEVAGSEANVDIVIHHLTQGGKLRQDNPSHYNRIEWLIIFNACKDDQRDEPKELRLSQTADRDPKSLNNWSYNSPAFIEKCRKAIDKVRDGKVAEANEMPLENGNSKKVMGQSLPFRKLQMDKQLKTWLIEADGTKKAISCREIAMQFDSYEKGIIKQLRTGIECGADISTVELDD